MRQMEGCLAMLGLKAERLLGWRWVHDGLEGWLCARLESCLVVVGTKCCSGWSWWWPGDWWARLSSGGWDTSSLVKKTSALEIWSLADAVWHQPLHLPCNMQTHHLAEPSTAKTIAQHLFKRSNISKIWSNLESTYGGHTSSQIWCSSVHSTQNQPGQNHPKFRWIADCQILLKLGMWVQYGSAEVVEGSKSTSGQIQDGRWCP